MFSKKPISKWNRIYSCGFAVSELQKWPVLFHLHFPFWFSKPSSPLALPSPLLPPPQGWTTSVLSASADVFFAWDAVFPDVNLANSYLSLHLHLANQGGSSIHSSLSAEVWWKIAKAYYTEWSKSERKTNTVH